MNMLRILLLILIIASAPAFASEVQYVPPQSAELNLYLDSQIGNRAVFIADFTALLGEVRNVSCYFESSGGIKVEPEEAEIERLESGRIKAFKFTASIPSPRSGNTSPRWVRFRVEYTPDYRELKRHIADNYVEFPDEFARNQLYDFVEAAEKDQLTASDMVRFFFQ